MSTRANCRLKGIQFLLVVEFLVGLVFPCDTRPIPSSGDSKHANSERRYSDTGNKKNTHTVRHMNTLDRLTQTAQQQHKLNKKTNCRNERLGSLQIQMHWA